MKSKSGIADQILSLPKGGGAIQGIGENFQVDLHKGTLNASISIQLPAGRNKFTPALSLSYSSGNGNSPFGLGWSLSVPAITRKTSRGIPRYQDQAANWAERDVFTFNGQDLLLDQENYQVGDEQNETHQIYHPKVAGNFSRIKRIIGVSYDYWIVQAKNGKTFTYGSPETYHGVYAEHQPHRIFSWQLTELTDPFGNKICYTYQRDHGEVDLVSHLEKNHQYNQLYLSKVSYVHYTIANRPLYTVEFDYGEHQDNEVDLREVYVPERTQAWSIRPDPFSYYKSGFEIRTARRCRRIFVNVHELDIDNPDNPPELIKAYHLDYDDERISLLRSVTLVGYQAGKDPDKFPPVEFEYSRFTPHTQHFESLDFANGSAPERSLSDPNVALIDLFGNGLPCILHTDPSGYRYWRNIGDNKFDHVREMPEHPPVSLANHGVMFADMYGNGSADLIISQGPTAGFFETNFDGTWEAWHRYTEAPSFNLEDPSVQLFDITGDGVTDVCQSSSDEFVFYPNHGEAGWGEPQVIPKLHDLDQFPDVSFNDSEQRVRLADMTGDGMQDIVLIQQGHIDYWPNLGYGRFAKRITMSVIPALPDRFLSSQVFLSDVDGDGCADLIYVNKSSVTLWINSQGNGFSQHQVIEGTPQTIMDAVTVVDIKGQGVQGILWSYDVGIMQEHRNLFLDLTGGVKPYLLTSIDNHMGALTKFSYRPSTWFYAQDQKSRLAWKTHLPFPVQCVASVSRYDHFSHNKLVTTYRYHHGHWDGIERVFVGFGRVDQCDTERFQDYNLPSLYPEIEFTGMELSAHSPPIEVRTWFHLGPIGQHWQTLETLDCRDEYWMDDQEPLSALILNQDQFYYGQLTYQERREAIRVLRGSILRSELYGLDDSPLEDFPYKITELMFRVRPLALSDESINSYHFFPHQLIQRVTQWDRGDDPMIAYNYYQDYDAYGQVTDQLQFTLPRRVDQFPDKQGLFLDNRALIPNRYFIMKSVTVYANPDEQASTYIVDRKSQVTDYEYRNINHQLSFVELLNLMRTDPNELKPSVIAQTRNYYDGEAFQELSLHSIGKYGVLTRTEQLAFTEELLNSIYNPDTYPDDWEGNLDAASFLSSEGQMTWSDDYPVAFKEANKISGYISRDIFNGIDSIGYYVVTVQNDYDYNVQHGELIATTDALNHVTKIGYDSYHLLPTTITSPIKKNVIKAEYDYRVGLPRMVMDPNYNTMNYRFTALGLVSHNYVTGKDDEGDTEEQPTMTYGYDLNAYDKNDKQPISVHTTQREHHFSQENEQTLIEIREYSDGFGRLLQSRMQAEHYVYGDTLLGDVNLSLEIDQHSDAGDKQKEEEDNINIVRNFIKNRVIVSGWQHYNNKGTVVRKFEPFFAQGWEYEELSSEKLRDFDFKSIEIYFDPLQRVVREVNPDGSEKLTIFGVPYDLSHPDAKNFKPTAWETYEYDGNDNAGRTHGQDSKSFDHHRNLPRSIKQDGLNRDIQLTERTRGWKESEDNHIKWDEDQDQDQDQIISVYTTKLYDIKGNLIEIWDPKQRQLPAFKNFYDLMEHEIRSESIDAGMRLQMLNAAGQLIEQRDSKGSRQLFCYDSMLRLIKVWACNKKDQPLTLREKYVYAESQEAKLSDDNARQHNLLGELYQVYDEAGIVTYASFDFKGNSVIIRRQVIADEAIVAVNPDPFIVDWDADPALGDVYEIRMTYDALNRMTEVELPTHSNEESKRLISEFNAGGGLEKVRLNDTVFVNDIGYNAKGQRLIVCYGNHMMTRYAYDRDTFLLGRLRTERYYPGVDENSFTVSEEDEPVQDTSFAYDLAGNILSMTEQRPGCGVPDTDLGLNRLERKFIYDPLGQLVEATGRESTPQQMLPSEPGVEPDPAPVVVPPPPPPGPVQPPAPQPDPIPPRPPGGAAAFFQNLFSCCYRRRNRRHERIADVEIAEQERASNKTQAILMDTDAEEEARGPIQIDATMVPRSDPNEIELEQATQKSALPWNGSVKEKDINHTRPYTRRYFYDEVGNLVKIKHQSRESKLYCRKYSFFAESNRLKHLKVTSHTQEIVSEEIKYELDYSGNVISEHEYRRLNWDHNNRLCQFENAKTKRTVYYLYDSGGQRVKKIRIHEDTVAVTAYIHGLFEHYREYERQGNELQLIKERQSYHIMHDQSRIAIVHKEMNKPDKTEYQHNDHLGSGVVVTTHQPGEDMDMGIYVEEYMPFGETSFGGQKEKRYRYTGKETDIESSLQYYGARYYAPWLGRWLSCDPLGSSSGINLYQYNGNNPIVFFDPDGKSRLHAALYTLSRILAHTKIGSTTTKWLRKITNPIIRGLKALRQKPNIPRPKINTMSQKDWLSSQHGQHVSRYARTQIRNQVKFANQYIDQVRAHQDKLLDIFNSSKLFHSALNIATHRRDVIGGAASTMTFLFSVAMILGEPSIKDVPHKINSVSMYDTRNELKINPRTPFFKVLPLLNISPTNTQEPGNNDKELGPVLPLRPSIPTEPNIFPDSEYRQTRTSY